MRKIVITCVAILSVVVCLSEIKSVEADSFYPTGDIINCKFAHGIGLSVEELGDNVDFNSSAIYGKDHSWMINHDIHDIADVRIGSLDRYSDIATRVAVPPGSRIGVYFFPYNFSYHKIGVLNSWLFLSDNKNEMLSEIANISPKYRSIAYISNGVLHSKKGMSLSFGMLGNFGNTSWFGVPKGKKIGEFSIIQPIDVEIVNHECTEDNIHNFGIKLDNLARGPEEVNFEDVDLSIDPSSSRYLYSKTQSNSLSFRVKEKEICFGNSGGKYDSSDPNQYVFLLSRNDYNHWAWGSIQPEIPTISNSTPYCITRVEYSLGLDLPSCPVPKEKVVIKNPIEDVYLVPGEEKSVDVIIANIGSADATNLELSILNNLNLDVQINNENAVSIPKNAEIQVNLTISAPIDIAEESINFIFSYGDDYEEVGVHINKHTDLEFAFTLFPTCIESGKYEGIMRFSNNGNTIINNPSIDIHSRDNEQLSFPDHNVIKIDNQKLTLQGEYLPGQYSFPFKILSSDSRIYFASGDKEYFSMCSISGENNSTYDIPEVQIAISDTLEADVMINEGKAVSIPNTSITVANFFQEYLVFRSVPFFYVFYNFFSNVLSSRRFKTFKLW